MDLILIAEIIATPILYFYLGFFLYKKMPPKFYGCLLYVALFYLFGNVMKEMMLMVDVEFIQKIDYNILTLEELVQFNRICQVFAMVSPVVSHAFYLTAGWFITKFMAAAVPKMA